MNTVVSDRTAELCDLCRRYHVASLAVFRSALTSAFVPASSDLDFVVRFTPMDPVDRADAYLGLLTSLERLFDRPIDLVEDDAVRNPYLRREIDGTRRVVYGA
jgi:predicted nucleotidyltransferase